MRAIWKGSISFGLFNIPISLYSATRSEELKFRLLRASDHSPVNYKRVAQADGKEVPWDQIVKGYEYEKDRFVILKTEDFKRVDIEATQTVEILDFVVLREINPIYFQKPFYMEPTRNGTKAYVLLREALQNTGKIGVAKVVIKTRQHLAAVKPNGDGLVLELMHFADELVDAAELHLPQKAEIRKTEMEMAQLLIDRMTEPWKPERYKDEYRSALLELIDKKVQTGGGELNLPPRRSKAPENVVDIAEVLKRSLAASERATSAPRRRTKSREKEKAKPARKRAA